MPIFLLKKKNVSPNGKKCNKDIVYYMSKFKFILVSLSILGLLTSCAVEQPRTPKTEIKDKIQNSIAENNDLTLKAEGLAYNFKSTIEKYNVDKNIQSSCPIYIPDSVSVKKSNFRLYDVSAESADNQFTIPRTVAFCNLDLDGEKYVLILASYLNSGDIDKALANAFESNGEKFIYLGLPTGLIINNSESLENLRMIDGKVSTDDCVFDSPEFSDSDCPSGQATYFRVDGFLVVLTQRVAKGYIPSKDAQYQTGEVLKSIY